MGMRLGEINSTKKEPLGLLTRWLPPSFWPLLGARQPGAERCQGAALLAPAHHPAPQLSTRCSAALPPGSLSIWVQHIFQNEGSACRRAGHGTTFFQLEHDLATLPVSTTGFGWRKQLHAQLRGDGRSQVLDAQMSLLMELVTRTELPSLL